jgi:hypothetical protein
MSALKNAFLFCLLRQAFVLLKLFQSLSVFALVWTALPRCPAFVLFTSNFNYTDSVNAEAMPAFKQLSLQK